MKKIEILSLDNKLADRITKALEVKVKESQLESISIVSEDCLLSEILKLVKTYPSVDLDKTGLVLLESARENQIQLEQIRKELNKETIVVQSGSFIANMNLLLMHPDVKRVITKHLIKKIGLPADAIFYVRPNMKDFLERRRHFSVTQRIEDSMRGLGFKSRDKKFPKILNNLNSKYGTKCSIIEVDDRQEDISIPVDAMFNFLKQEGVL